MSVVIAQITDAALDVAAHLATVQTTSVGAVTSFVGTVRVSDPDADSAVVALEYTAHPDAAAALRAIAESACGDGGAVIAVSHRIGHLGVGEAAVVIAVGAAHREEAFTVCRAVIEGIKTSLPVWKKQFTADGAAAWKGVGG